MAAALESYGRGGDTYGAVDEVYGVEDEYLPFRSQRSSGQPGPSDPLTNLPRRPWTPT